MSLNINFNFGGGGGFGGGGCGMGGFNPMMGIGGFNPMGGMGGFNPMMGMGGGGFNNPMMQMMQMLQMLMSLMMGMNGMGGGAMPMCPSQGFGCGGCSPCGGGGGGGGCGSPVGNFLGGGGGPCGGNYDNGNYGNSGPVPGGQQGDGSGNSTIELARRFLGQRSHDIRGQMPHFTAAGGYTNNCADFVSAALQGSGRIHGHDVNCRALERRLKAEGWHQVPANQARPGDVIFNQSRGHVQLAEGNGRQIGSNNVRPGLQYVSEGRMGRNVVVYTK
jgi:hypothetical protein